MELVILTVTILLAALTVEVKDLLYAVLCLCGMSIAVGILFGLMDAPYLMVFQLLVYAGAVIALFLSVVMFVRRDES